MGATKKVTLTLNCDNVSFDCPMTQSVFNSSSVRKAKEKATRAGWTTTPRKWICPTCSINLKL